MSFEVYLQCFQDGLDSKFPRHHFERIFAAHIAERDTAYRCIMLEYPNGARSDIYIKNDEEIDGFMVSRPGGTQLFNDLYQLMKEVGAVLYWPGDAPCLAVADPIIVTKLPPDMIDALGPAIIVSSGSEIIDAIQKS